MKSAKNIHQEQKQPVRLYNTMSREIEAVESFDGTDEIGFYACGPTVYDYAHLGHLRKYTMDDVLLRILRVSGYQVKFVENITDVGHLSSDSDIGEDKMEKGARKYGKTVWELAEQFEDYFWRSMDIMHVTRPDVVAHATKHIQEQLDMVLALEERGFTYEIEGDGIYFDTSKLEDYGKLARLNLEELEEGARIGAVEGKRNPTDFALWKFEKEGENRAMVWPSPWAERSFPGWHIECSAMSMTHLGEQIEIHTGGIDHIPVHHTNEIAQAEASTGKQPFVKYWVHHNFLQVEGEKMSKSLGNFLTIDDVLDRGTAPMALRLLFLSSHYRSQLNFTWDALEGQQRAWRRLQQQLVESRDTLDSLKSVLSGDVLLGEEAKAYSSAFFEAVRDDLATPRAMATVWEVVASQNITEAERLRLFLQFDQIMGLGLRELLMDEDALTEIRTLKGMSVEQLPEAVRSLAEDRLTARAEHRYQDADQLRDEIRDAGYRVEDTADGQRFFSVAE